MPRHVFRLVFPQLFAMIFWFLRSRWPGGVVGVGLDGAAPRANLVLLAVSPVGARPNAQRASAPLHRPDDGVEGLVARLQVPPVQRGHPQGLQQSRRV